MRLMTVVVAAAACGGGNAKPSPDAAPDAPALRAVTGTYNFDFLTPSGERSVPLDLSSATVSALVPPDDRAIPGATTANGTFEIDSVPVGTYLLDLGSRYAELTADTVDLSADLLGRQTLSFATNPTNLSFSVTGMTAWQSGDELNLFSADSGTAAYSIEAFAGSGAPAASDTALTNLTYDLRYADYPSLIQSGDRVTFAHLVTQSDGTRTFRTAAESFAPASFDLTNGGGANLTGAFTAAPTSTLALTWDRPMFDADIVAHVPGTTTMNWSTLAISALPEAATRGYFHEGADVVVFAPGYMTDTSTVTTSWTYGDPYPTTWSRVAWVRYYRYRSISVSGATATPVFARILAYRDLSTVTAQAPIDPIIGTVSAPLVNGMAADVGGKLSGVTTTPTVSWTAPAIGTPSRYYVSISEVYVASGATTLRTVATFETSATQLTVPPMVLASGNSYLFQIAARSLPAGIDLAATPQRLGLPDGESNVPTAIVTP